MQNDYKFEGRFKISNSNICLYVIEGKLKKYIRIINESCIYEGLWKKNDFYNCTILNNNVLYQVKNGKTNMEIENKNNSFSLDIKCPKGRSVNNITGKTIVLNGLEDKCFICLEDNNLVVFTTCKHANFCLNCAKQIK